MNHFSGDRDFKPRRGAGRPGGGGGGGFNRGGFGGGGGRGGGSQMHPATCSDCGRSCEVPFKPTGNKPVFCRDCFQGQRNEPSRDFGGGRDGGRGRGRDDFNKRDFAGNRNSGPSMHHATCSDCGNDCEVPFRPTGSKPVYCSNCFQDHRNEPSGDFGGRDAGGRNKGGGFNDRPSGKPHFEDRKMHISLCDTCGNKFELPFLPKGGRPVYCDNCFGQDSGVKEDKVEIIKEQFDLMNEKLDKLIKLLLPVVSPGSVEFEVEKEVKKMKKEASKPKKAEKKQASSAKVEEKVVAKKVASKKTSAKKVKKAAAKKVSKKKAPAKGKKKATTKKASTKKKAALKKKK